jgi:hypothetical protein
MVAVTAVSGSLARPALIVARWAKAHFVSILIQIPATAVVVGLSVGLVKPALMVSVVVALARLALAERSAAVTLA